MQTNQSEKRPGRQQLGEEPITVHGFGLTTSSTIHLYGDCRPNLKDLGTVTVRGTQICLECRRRKVAEARAAK